jgi:hypothetical protein
MPVRTPVQRSFRHRELLTRVKPGVANWERFMPEDRTGFSVRQNKKNGFVVIELDFIADPMKRATEWIDAERQGMPPKQWAIEMQRSWETFLGRPIYEGAYHRHLHVLAAATAPNTNYPIFRGWDFGGNQSCCITQIIGSRLVVLDEMPNGGVNTRKFAPDVIAYCNANFGSDFHYIDIVDPSAAWEGKTAEGKACTDVMRDEGLHPVAAPTNDPEKRIDAVIRLLMRNDTDGKPCLWVNPHCTMLIKGFEGGYHYPDKPTQSKKSDRPVKNLYSHIHDALQYVALRMMSHEKRTRDEDTDYESSLTRPRYKFNG